MLFDFIPTEDLDVIAARCATEALRPTDEGYPGTMVYGAAMDLTGLTAIPTRVSSSSIRVSAENRSPSPGNPISDLSEKKFLILPIPSPILYTH